MGPPEVARKETRLPTNGQQQKKEKVCRSTAHQPQRRRMFCCATSVLKGVRGTRQGRGKASRAAPRRSGRPRKSASTSGRRKNGTEKLHGLHRCDQFWNRSHRIARWSMRGARRSSVREGTDPNVSKIRVCKRNSFCRETTGKQFLSSTGIRDDDDGVVVSSVVLWRRRKLPVSSIEVSSPPQTTLAARSPLEATATRR